MVLSLVIVVLSFVVRSFFLPSFHRCPTSFLIRIRLLVDYEAEKISLFSSNDIFHKFLFCSVIGCHIFRVPGHKDSNKFQCSTLYIAAFLLCAHRHVRLPSCWLLPGILYISCSFFLNVSSTCYSLLLLV